MKYNIQNNNEYRVSPDNSSFVKGLWNFIWGIIRKFISSGGSGGVYL